MKRLLPLIMLAAFLTVLPGCRNKEDRSAFDAAGAGEELISERDIEKTQSFEQAPSGGAKLKRTESAEGFDRTSTGDDLGLPSSRMIIKTASLSIKVKNVDSVYSAIVDLADTRGGYIQSANMYTSDGARADITIKIDPNDFADIISSLESFGEVEYKSISGEDVTEEYFDLSAELQTQLALRTRLFDLLNRARNVSEAIQVEQELQRVDYNVNRIKGRMKYLEQMVGESTVTVSIYDTEAAREPGPWLVILYVFVVLVLLAGLVLGMVWVITRITRGRKKH